MAVNGSTLFGVIFAITLVLISPSLSLSVHQNINDKTMNSTTVEMAEEGAGFLSKVLNFLWSSGSGYQHTWPVTVYSSHSPKLFSLFLII